MSDRPSIRTSGRSTVRVVRPYVRTSGRRAARFAGKGVGWGGGVLTKAERAARVHYKAERAARFHFSIFNFQNSSLAQPSARVRKYLGRKPTLSNWLTVVPAHGTAGFGKDFIKLELQNTSGCDNFNFGCVFVCVLAVTYDFENRGKWERI